MSKERSQQCSVIFHDVKTKSCGCPTNKYCKKCGLPRLFDTFQVLQPKHKEQQVCASSCIHSTKCKVSKAFQHLCNVQPTVQESIIEKISNVNKISQVYILPTNVESIITKTDRSKSSGARKASDLSDEPVWNVETTIQKRKWADLYGPEHISEEKSTQWEGHKSSRSCRSGCTMEKVHQALMQIYDALKEKIGHQQNTSFQSYRGNCRNVKQLVYIFHI